jgi:hypothetical protein
MEPRERSPRLPNLGEKLQHLPKVGWLERLLYGSASEQGGDVMSGGDGSERDNGAAEAELDDELSAAIDDAARKGIKRVEDQDPLGEGKTGIMPLLLIGQQMSYDPNVWRPNYSLLPENDPERIAFERGEPIPLHESKRYKATMEFLEEIDAELGWPE